MSINKCQPLCCMASTVLLLAASVFADERDAVMFGDATEVTGEESPTISKSATQSPDFDRLDFGDEAAALEQRTADANDKLAIGGQVYLRLSYALARHANGLKEPLSSPNLADLYLDARPSDRVRAFASGRLRYNPLYDPRIFSLSAAQAETYAVDLDQLWLKFDAGRKVYFTLGKQPLKWGTGRFWNPTDFLNPQIRDPLAVFDERLGLPLFKVHVPFEAKGVNVYGVANLDGASQPQNIGGALRLEWLTGAAEWSLSTAVKRNQPYLLGADLSAALWDIDLKAEVAVRTDDRSAYWQGPFAVTPPVLPRAVDRSGDWIPQAVLGAEYAFNYSDEDSLALGVEYFFNDAGYASSDLYPWLLFGGGFKPLYNGRHYAGAYALAAGPGRWDDHTFIVSNLSNWSDLTHLLRLDWRYVAHRYLSLDFASSLHYGRVGEFNFALDIPPLPFVPELANGFSVPKPLVDISLGARVKF